MFVKCNKIMNDMFKLRINGTEQTQNKLLVYLKLIDMKNNANRKFKK